MGREARIAEIGYQIVLVLVSIIVLLRFVPLMPAFPEAGLDSAWDFSTNEAVAQRLVFGREFLSTYGPYGAIYTWQYHPETDRMIILAAGFLALCYLVILFYLPWRSRPGLLVAYSIMLFGILSPGPYADVLLFSYPLILTVACQRNFASGLPSRSCLIALLFGFTGLALLPLIKISLLVPFGVTLIVCWYFIWHKGAKPYACCTVAVSLISLTLLWILSGQPPPGLPTYIMNAGVYIAGYTDAMSLPGNPSEPIIYILVVIVLMLVLLIGLEAHSRFVLATAFSLFLFMGFKQGFVRHDAHAQLAALCLLTAGLFAGALIRQVSLASAVLVIAVLAWVYIDKSYSDTSVATIYSTFKHNYRSNLNALRIRLTSSDELQKIYARRLDLIKAELLLRQLPGTTDIYSYGQSRLFASGNKWAPRPMPQSLTAFTPVLARLNEKHLRSASRPDNIIFKVEPIDGRLPALEDGLSWPTLINNYAVTMFENGYLYFKKRDKIQQGVKVQIYNGKWGLGSKLDLPLGNGAVFAELDVQASAIGKFVSLLFKLPSLHLELCDIDNVINTYRLIPGMAKAGFIISPLVQTTQDFAILTSSIQEHKKIKSIAVHVSGPWAILWTKSYSVKLYKIVLKGDTVLSKISVAAGVPGDVPTTNDAGVECYDSIDKKKR